MHFVISRFVGAIEKQKLVYILNRDAEARLTISSPLEAHKSNTLVYHTVGVDAGFENPMFACLEIDYEVAHALFNCSPLLRAL
jgi:splicing factor 3B subunit 3